MIEIKYTTINAKTLCENTKNKSYVYDNPIQRGYVWRRDKKSLLMHSIIFGFPIPAIYANYSNGIYDVFDGKQRCNTIVEFMENKFKLSVVPSVEYNDEEYELTGKYFKDLDKFFQERIELFSLSVAYGHNLTQDEVREMFIRLNNGKPLTATEILKAKTKAGVVVDELSKHKIFTIVMNKDNIEASKNISFIHQTYAMLFPQDGCISLLNTQLTKIFSNIDITQEQFDKMAACYDLFLNIFEILAQNKKKNLQYIVILKRKVHFISMIPVIELALKEKISSELVVTWIQSFFSPELGVTTADVDYNNSLISGINRPTLVENRKSAILNNFSNFCKETV